MRCPARRPGALSFTAGIFRRVSSLNLLGPIARGRIQVVAGAEQVIVSYRLHFGQLLVCSALMAALPGLFPTMCGPSSVQGWLGYSWHPFLWFPGGNMLIAIAGPGGAVRRWLAQAVGETSARSE